MSGEHCFIEVCRMCGKKFGDVVGVEDECQAPDNADFLAENARLKKELSDAAWKRSGLAYENAAAIGKLNTALGENAALKARVKELTDLFYVMVHGHVQDDVWAVIQRRLSGNTLEEL